MLADSEVRPCSHPHLTSAYVFLNQGKVSAPRSLLGRKPFWTPGICPSNTEVHAAGLGAGMTEAIFAVTPSETIK